MTAPAVIRRWNDPPVPVGRGAPESAVVRATLARHFVRLARVGPLGAVLLSGLVLHAGVAPHLSVGGAAPDVLLIAVVAVAAARGSTAGAVFGFAAGLGADVFLATPLGTSALAYTLVGHVLGGWSRQPRAGSAAALCRPGSACFSCRTGRHRAGAQSAGQAMAETGRRPSRAHRRAAARRAALRRSLALTAVGVGVGHLTAAVVATTLGGAAFPGIPGLVRIAAVAAFSAPLGPPAAAALQRLTARREEAT